MNKKIRKEAMDHLFDAILSLKDREECYTFFEDVCTINELFPLRRDLKSRICCGSRKRIWTSQKKRAHRQRPSAGSTVP